MERVTKAYDVKPGDVLVIDVTITDRQTGQDRNWRRYGCVLRTAGKQDIEVMTLKLHPEPKDIRHISLRSDNERVYLLAEDKWPQGVVAMRMKHIAQGRIKLGES